jgi:C-terminal processing protease CtpA/Prc
MKSRASTLIAAIAAVSLAITACSAAAPNLPSLSGVFGGYSGPAIQSGPKLITGSVSYTDPLFTAGVAEPEVILEDETGFVRRDRHYLIPIQSQVLGEITSDFNKSPFTYSLSLPAEPNAPLNDVNHDGKKDKGVMIFAIAYWTNTWGDAYLELRDQGGGGWSNAYVSTKVSQDQATYMEVYGGKYLVWAPDDKQQFPSGFGADKKLFTDDDPLMNLQAGWSMIDMDKTPFAIDRSDKLSIDLLEGQAAAADDFSKLSYTDAFDKMVQKFKTEYAWTDLKHIDWDAKAKQFRPEFVAAQNSADPHAYALALRDFFWSIPDSHVGFDESLLQKDFQTAVSGGLGFAIRETDDGSIVANYITAGGSADKAGMKFGAKIASLDGKPIEDAINSTVPWSSPFSNPIIKRLQQLRYATRFPLDKGQVEVTFTNPGGSPQTVSLAVTNEIDSFQQASFLAGQAPTALPVEYQVLPDGLGYIKINSFFDNAVLTIQIWERAIRYFNDHQVTGVILDLRQNSGGNGWLADQMAGYFFDKVTVVGEGSRYNKQSKQWYMDPAEQAKMYPPSTDLQYKGKVAVLVGPACASSCEFFSYDMTISNRATVVGEYPSEGAGAGIEAFTMPEGIYCQLPVVREFDPNGNVNIEIKGVVPTIKVPVTLETLQREANGEDVTLEAAEKTLGG